MDKTKSLPPILYVDDEEDNLTVFNSAFRRDYEVHIALSGQEGLEIMKKNEIQLIITDQRMPEMTGIQFLEKIIPDYPDCIRMILTGFSDIEAIIQAINTGRVYRYITKPWSKEDLKINIDKALETYHLRDQNRKLIESLKEANLTLEQKVIERTKKIEAQNREITCSMHYASRIQHALLPPNEELKKLLPSYFILNKPRDIVSGDYYWLAYKDDKVIIAVADCTGHGIPGAFMSILGVAFLNEIVNKAVTIRANEVLNQLCGQVIKSLHQTGKNDKTRDGMEMALCVIDSGKQKLQYSGAFRPLYLIRDNELKEFKGDNMPIGIYEQEDQSFSNKEIPYKKNDIIYLFTDGYVDQLGGTDRKTFRSENFKKLLIEIQSKPMNEQKKALEKKFEEWRGEIDQVDDILIVGIKM
ncbi:MAG: SpoIIE family protein phosphatase [Bacteroidia bacterium]|nr:SpoIIE family protein phosphatase [Bacteroidia bacterium]